LLGAVGLGGLGGGFLGQLARPVTQGALLGRQTVHV
jgi:hypothetical protein